MTIKLKLLVLWFLSFQFLFYMVIASSISLEKEKIKGQPDSLTEIGLAEDYEVQKLLIIASDGNNIADNFLKKSNGLKSSHPGRTLEGSENEGTKRDMKSSARNKFNQETKSNFDDWRQKIGKNQVSPIGLRKMHLLGKAMKEEYPQIFSSEKGIVNTAKFRIESLNSTGSVLSAISFFSAIATHSPYMAEHKEEEERKKLYSPFLRLDESPADKVIKELKEELESGKAPGVPLGMDPVYVTKIQKKDPLFDLNHHHICKAEGLFDNSLKKEIEELRKGFNQLNSDQKKILKDDTTILAEKLGLKENSQFKQLIDKGGDNEENWLQTSRAIMYAMDKYNNAEDISEFGEEKELGKVFNKLSRKYDWLYLVFKGALDATARQIMISPLIEEILDKVGPSQKSKNDFNSSQEYSVWYYQSTKLTQAALRSVLFEGINFNCIEKKALEKETTLSGNNCDLPKEASTLVFEILKKKDTILKSHNQQNENKSGEENTFIKLRVDGKYQKLCPEKICTLASFIATLRSPDKLRADWAAVCKLNSPPPSVPTDLPYLMYWLGGVLGLFILFFVLVLRSFFSSFEKSKQEEGNEAPPLSLDFSRGTAKEDFRMDVNDATARANVKQF